MLKRFLILSISVLTAVLSLETAMAAPAKASRSKAKGVLIAQNSSVSLAQTEASASTETTADSTASGINMSKIPIAAIANAEEKPKSFTLTLGAERGSNLVAEDADGDKTSTSFMIMPALKLSENVSSFVRTYIENEENGPRNTTVSDTQINLTLSGSKLTEQIGTNYSLNGFAPTSESNRKETRFQGAGGVAVKFAGEFTFANISYSLSYRRNVHEFTISAEGKANIRDVVGQTISAEIPLSQKFSISSLGIYRNSWTYANSLRQGFSYDLDLNYEAAKNLSFNVGTSNEGSALKANGKDSNVQFYDDKSSVIRAGVTYVL